MTNSTDKKIRVVIADDHEVIIDGLTEMLNHESDIQIVGKALNGEIVLDIVKNKAVDIVLMDVEMPVMDGLEATQKLKEKHPHIGVLMLTQYSKTGLISQAIKNGAGGYIMKTANKKTLIEGIRAVFNGELYTGGVKLPSAYAIQNNISLSDREKEIICLIVQEKTAREIAADLKLTTNTVNHHLKNIRSKLGVKNVVGLVNYAHKNNLCK